MPPADLPTNAPSPNYRHDLTPEEEVRVVCAIPARYASQRLPGKVLLPIGGRPMIQRVYERAKSAERIDRVIVLTDDQRVVEAVEGFGGEIEITPTDLASGTDRIAWSARNWPEEAIINVQGDEPMLDPKMVTRIADHMRKHPDDQMVTAAAPADAGDSDDPAKVKVVVDADGHALYFSRAAIPYRVESDSGGPPPPRLRHVGIYGYRRQTLLTLSRLPASRYERSERLEQLRALENGIPIRVLIGEHHGFGVDTQEDLARAAKILETQDSVSA